MALRHNARVVITGLGPVAACGIGISSFWDALQHARSGIGPITLFDTSRYDAKLAGEVKDFNLEQYFTPKTPLRRLARQTQLALAATHLAIQDAQLDFHQRDVTREIPVELGVSTSAYNMVEQAAEQLITKGPHRVSPYSSPASQPHQAVSVIAQEFGLTSMAQTISSACPSGLDAIWSGAQLILSGKSEVVLAGGCDAPVCALGIACLQQSGLVSKSKPTDHRIGGPFNRGNDSGFISEGAGMVVLEEYSSARARGAKMYAEIVAASSTIDLPDEQMLEGLHRAMDDVLHHAGLTPKDIDYICAHGSGHPFLDRAEVAQIKRLMGAQAQRIPISSIKGSVGNPLAGGGPLQVIASALAIHNQIVPPTANLHELDPACDLDIVAHQGRRANLRHVLINAHGLGGGNSCMVLRRIEAA